MKDFEINFHVGSNNEAVSRVEAALPKAHDETTVEGRIRAFMIGEIMGLQWAFPNSIIVRARYSTIGDDGVQRRTASKLFFECAVSNPLAK